MGHGNGGSGGENIPQKYRPTDRQWATKESLYEKYWGDLLSLREIARDVGETVSAVSREMEKLGIPRRSCAYRKGESSNPIACFYDSQHLREDVLEDVDGVERDVDWSDLD